MNEPEVVQPPLPGTAGRPCKRGQHIPTGRGPWKRCLRCDALIYRTTRRRKAA